MSNLLDTASQPDDGPIICTITGDPGVGKTLLASTFPSPFFIRAEDGMKSIPIKSRPKATPLITSSAQLQDWFKALVTESHDFKTLVIDSVTQLDAMFSEEVMASDPKNPKSLATAMGGYGAGYQAVASMHQRVRKAAGALNSRRGMHVVFIAHSETTTIEPPDQDPYTRYELRLHKKSVGAYVDNVDMVAHIKLETFTSGEGDRKKAISTGGRIAVVRAAAAQVSKNRFSITEDLPVEIGQNPFAAYIPSLAQ